jgi:predicted RNA binding protein YcfA (HicA-like mRNA interferase family)
MPSKATERNVLKQALEKKGFVLDRIRGSHHVYVHPETKVTISLPVHRKEIKKGHTFRCNEAGRDYKRRIDRSLIEKHAEDPSSLGGGFEDTLKNCIWCF